MNPAASAAVELIHVGALECDGNPYPAWRDNGRLCVKQRVLARYRDGGAR
jgi:hypothetical protein